MDFLDIIFRGFERLFGNKPPKDQSRFEAGQNTVAAVIVIGGLVFLAGAAVVALVG
jgi:hypothetical protein